MNPSSSYVDTAWRELSPGWLMAMLPMLGYAPLRQETGFALCDLACGTGYSAALTAASMPSAQVDGFDLDPAHIAAARALALEANLPNARFTVADIRALADAPPRRYSMIVVHGIASWVAADVREALYRFIGAALDDGGVAYLHYASMPGASTFGALNAAMRAAAPAGTPAERLAGAVPHLQAMRQGAGLFAAHRKAGSSFDSLLRQDAAYVAHELAGDVFEPLSSGDVIAAMARQGCVYAGSATPLDNIDHMSVPAACLPALQAVTDPALREVLKDIARDQALRRDIYIRNGRALAADAHLAALRTLNFRLMADLPDGALTVETPIGPVEAAAHVVSPLVAALRRGPGGFPTLERLPVFAGRPGLLNQTLALLMQAGIVRPCRSDDPGAGTGPGTGTFNRVATARRRNGRGAPALADASLMGPVAF